MQRVIVDNHTDRRSLGETPARYPWPLLRTRLERHVQVRLAAIYLPTTDSHSINFSTFETPFYYFLLINVTERRLCVNSPALLPDCFYVWRYQAFRPVSIKSVLKHNVLPCGQKWIFVSCENKNKFINNSLKNLLVWISWRSDSYS